MSAYIYLVGCDFVKSIGSFSSPPTKRWQSTRGTRNNAVKQFKLCQPSFGLGPLGYDKGTQVTGFNRVVRYIRQQRFLFEKKCSSPSHAPVAAHFPRICRREAAQGGGGLLQKRATFFCNVAHCASIELGCALVIVHVRFKWRTNLRISVCRPRSRRWWPIFKTCVCFACGCSFHYAYRLTLFDSGTSQMAAAPKLTA